MIKKASSNILIFILLLLTSVSLQAQNDTTSAGKKKIRVIYADNVFAEQTADGIWRDRLVGRVQIEHDSTLLFCDSAYHFRDRNFIEAYGNVKANMPRKTSMKCNTLTYDGNTKIGEAVGNASVTRESATLTSDKLTYFRALNYGQYTTGGKMVDGDNTLTSQFGYYYPDQGMAYFKQKVDLVNKDFHLDTDTLGYDTKKDLAIFMTQTHIRTDKGEEFNTTKGSYATKTKKLISESRTSIQDSSSIVNADFIDYDDKTQTAILKGNVHLEQKDKTGEVFGGYAVFQKDKNESMITENPIVYQYGKEDTTKITSDTLFYKEKNNEKIAIAKGNVHVTQKDSAMEVHGGYGIFNKDSEESMITQHPIAIQRDKDQVMYISSDTLFYKKKNNEKYGIAKGNVIMQQKDSSIEVRGGKGIFYQTKKETFISENPIAIQRFDDDTLFVTADTLHVREDSATQKRTFRAFNHVKIFMKDLRGKADSLVYHYSDSLIEMFRKPILWSDSSQLTGDTITIFMRHKKIDSLAVKTNSFLVSQEDTVGFNQMKGKQMRVKFVEGKLSRMHIIGNSESVYYIKDNKKGYQGMNKALSLEMLIYMKDNKTKKVVFKGKTDGKYSPIHEVLFQEIKLDGMDWRPSEKPEKPFVVPKSIKQELGI